ncbi:nitrogen regulation protein NR(II) [Dongia sp.]|uniref:two-component system sensor histidine kinase NtrB n=1 Tax=Dongia sp. TaxID=1977262 RepID=UPI003753B17A
MFEALITAAADGIILVDAEGHIRIFNPACARLFGYRPEEVTGKDVSILIPSPYRDAQNGRRLASRETLGRRKDGSTFPIYLSVGQGKAEGAEVSVCIVHDLTERGAAPLMDVSRLSAMAQMGSSMAHEINQPLAAVMNYVKAAQRTLETCHDARAAKAGELLAKAGEQIVRAGAIIRNRRDFIARGQPSRREEALYKIIEKAVARALTGPGAGTAKVTLTLDRKLPPVLVDKMQIQQVIIHLIRNALEAMQSMPEPRLSIECSSPQAGFAEVTISDSGPGLSEAEIGRLFQPFVTTKERGMGLGLTISKSIINAHGGRLWATPNPGAGVSFHFQLPLIEKTEQ